MFEVDHPATQAWKRDRAAALGLRAHPSHVFVAADLNTGTLEPTLVAAGFDMDQPAVFSWVGTTMYLAAAATSHLLGFVARCARGSEVALSYNVTPDFMDDSGRACVNALRPALSGQGEPAVSGCAPPAVEALIATSGLRVVDHPTSEVLWERYCSQRDETTRPYTVERLVTARHEGAG